MHNSLLEPMWISILNLLLNWRRTLGYQTYSIKNGEMIINCTAVYWLLMAASCSNGVCSHRCTLSKDKKHWIHRIQTSYILVIFFTKAQACGKETTNNELCMVGNFTTWKENQVGPHDTFWWTVVVVVFNEEK